MKRLACVLFELEDDESVDVLIQKIEALSHVKVCKTAIKRSSWKKQLGEMLIKLGVPTSCGGYKLLFAAVEAAEKDPRLSLEEIYKEVASKCNMNRTSVATQIRYVTDKIVDKNTVKQINDVLGAPKDTHIKLTPASLIKYFATTLF